MEFEQLIREFAKRREVAPPGPDDEGARLFIFDDHMFVRMCPLGRGRMALNGSIGELPAKGRETDELLARVLKINLARLADHDEVLTVADDSRELVLQKSIDIAAIAIDDFERAVARFLDALEFWRKAMADSAPVERPPMMLFP